MKYLTHHFLVWLRYKTRDVVRLISILLFCALFFCIVRFGDHYMSMLAVWAQPSVSSNQQTQQVEKPPTTSPQDYREFIKDEREALAKQAEGHYIKVNNLFDRMLWALTVFAAFLIGTAVWLFWKTRDDFRKEAKQIFEEQLGSAIAETRAKLESEVALITGYKNRKIAWVTQPGKPSIEKERAALERFGLRNLTVLTIKPYEKTIFDSYELIILSYEDSDDDRHLLEYIVESIKQKAPAVWLLVYTYNPDGNPFNNQKYQNEVLTRDFIKDFYWHVPAQFPATLVSQTLALSRFVGAQIR